MTDLSAVRSAIDGATDDLTDFRHKDARWVECREQYMRWCRTQQTDEWAKGDTEDTPQSEALLAIHRAATLPDAEFGASVRKTIDSLMRHCATWHANQCENNGRI